MIFFAVGGTCRMPGCRNGRASSPTASNSASLSISAETENPYILYHFAKVTCEAPLHTLDCVLPLWYKGNSALTNGLRPKVHAMFYGKAGVPFAAWLPVHWISAISASLEVLWRSWHNWCYVVSFRTEQAFQSLKSHEITISMTYPHP